MKNKIKIFFAMFLGIYLQSFSQNMTENVARSLFADQKASQVGDAVTILIVEQTSAENNATTKALRDSKISLSGSASVSNSNLGGSASGSGGTGNNFQGSGSTTNKGSIQAKLSARITEIDENGNLKIEGKRVLKVNDETTTIKVSGLIRPQDILPDNSIYSYKICDAEITFQGDGIISSAQGPGWITKLLRWLF